MGLFPLSRSVLLGLKGIDMLVEALSEDMLSYYVPFIIPISTQFGAEVRLFRNYANKKPVSTAQSFQSRI